MVLNATSYCRTKANINRGNNLFIYLLTKGNQLTLKYVS